MQDACLLRLLRRPVISMQRNGFHAFSRRCRLHINNWHMNCLKEKRKEKVMNIRKNLKRGFTLVELLVVIAVTSAAALLLPAVQSIR